MICPDCNNFRHNGACAAEPLTPPSRAFLIQQAVLNAAADIFPETVKAGMLPRELKRYTSSFGDWPETSMLFLAVPRHFAALVAKHGGTTCPTN